MYRVSPDKRPGSNEKLLDMEIIHQFFGIPQSLINEFPIALGKVGQQLEVTRSEAWFDVRQLCRPPI